MTGHVDKEQLNEMKLEELKQLAKDMGLDTTGVTRKAQYVDLIAAKEVIVEDEAVMEGIEVEAYEMETEDAEEDTAEDEAVMEGIEVEAYEVETEDAEEDTVEEEMDDTTKKRVVYVGPTLPGGLLTKGKILYGTDKSISDYVRPVIEKYPAAKELIVPMERAEKARREVKNANTVLYQRAKDLLK